MQLEFIFWWYTENSNKIQYCQCEHLKKRFSYIPHPAKRQKIRAICHWHLIRKLCNKALQLFKQTLYPELCQFRHIQPWGYSLNQNKGLHCLPKCTFIWEAHGLGHFTDGFSEGSCTDSQIGLTEETKPCEGTQVKQGNGGSEADLALRKVMKNSQPRIIIKFYIIFSLFLL